MPSNQGTVDYIMDQIRGAGNVSARKMFGEYGVFWEGRMAAIIADDRLYVKPTPAGKDYLGSVEEAPPYHGAKNYYHIPGEQWDDAEWLAGLIRATGAELPLLVLKSKKQS
jgi:TfoX/Sxy family transcriptional regulator of competence genes